MIPPGLSSPTGRGRLKPMTGHFSGITVKSDSDQLPHRPIKSSLAEVVAGRWRWPAPTESEKDRAAESRAL